MPTVGTKLRLRTGNNDKKTFSDVTIRKFDIFPMYLETLQKENLILSPRTNQPSDIAVFSIDESLSNVSISAVDFRVPKVGQPVILNGFGSNRLTSVTSPSESVFKFFFSRIDAIVENSIAATPNEITGNGKTQTIAKGDSGSPMYLQNDNMQNPPVIGVLSTSVTQSADGKASRTAFFGRLDKNALGNPEQWLRSTVPDLTEASSPGGTSDSGLDFSKSLIFNCQEDATSGFSVKLELLEGRNSSQGTVIVGEGDEKATVVQTQVEHKMIQGSPVRDEYLIVLKDSRLEISANLDQETPRAQALLTISNGTAGELIERKVTMKCSASVLE